jgi:antibiotic biosynthesis monooxygenase (ABM) superfamily enzyme
MRLYKRTLLAKLKYTRRLMAIKRIWHGWTTPENADKYENILHDEVFPSIEAKNIAGYRRIELLRRDRGAEVEFITIMTFDSLQNVIDFQGEDYQRCYVPDAAQKVLKRWDQTSAHFEAREVRSYD